MTWADPERAWAPYEPDARRPWNLRRAAHLLRRAAFGASWDELQRALRAGPGPTIERLLKPPTDVAAFNSIHDGYERAVASGQDAAPLRAWWLRRMVASPHPLLEKMTLFWHGHFAISNARVKSARLMSAHIQRLRAAALGSFDGLLESIASDPAVFLGRGAPASRKARPAEGFARALLEDYTLGAGVCGRGDLRAAARAFTGWFVLRGKLRYFAREHDGGGGELLGRRGALTGADVVRIAAAHPATARRIAAKLFRLLVAEQTLPGEDELIAALAEFFAAHRDIARLLERILRSSLFFSAEAYCSRVKSPLEFALGIVKACGGMVPTEPLGRDLAALGQDLYHPPTKHGWAGGRHWINPATWAGRCNLAFALLVDRGRYGGRLDPAALVRLEGGREASPPPPPAELRRLAHTLTTTPAYHLL